MPDLPKIIQCHCGHDAHKYRSRSFINHNGNKVFRLFYRCENCWSRTSVDYIPELDGKYVNVLDLMEEIRNQNNIIK